MDCKICDDSRYIKTTLENGREISIFCPMHSREGSEDHKSMAGGRGALALPPKQ